MNKETLKKTDSTELSATTETKKKAKEELKAKYRRIELEYSGRLHIDPKYKKPGKVLRIDNDDAATRNYLDKLGYTVVQRDVEVGSGSLKEPGNMGSAVHIEQGIIHSQPGILYEIDEDEYNARKEVEAEMNNEWLKNTIESAQRDDQIGKTFN